MRTDLTVSLETALKLKMTELLTIIRVRQDGDPGGGELPAQTTPHGHAEADIKAFLGLVQRVVDDHHTACLLDFVSVEAQNADVFFWTRDVIRIGQYCSGDSTGGCACKVCQVQTWVKE